MNHAVAWALFAASLCVGAGCAATTDDEQTASSSSEEGDDDGVVSDEGLGASADALSGSATVGGTAYTTATVNFRESPNGTVMRTIPRGSAVTILDSQPEDGFYHVRFDGTDGYVHGALLVLTRTTGHRLTTNAVYLGSCSFLGHCASADTKAAWKANKTIYFGCDGRATCSDSEAYISVPRSGVPCGTTVTLCRTSDPSVCVDAKVREKSDSNQRYELSVAAAKGLGYSPEDGFYPSGGDQQCNGSLNGDGRVTISY